MRNRLHAPPTACEPRFIPNSSLLIPNFFVGGIIVKMFFSSAISLMLLFVLLFNLSCAGIPQQSNTPIPSQQVQQQPQQSNTLIHSQQNQQKTVQSQAASSPYYTGDGGKGMGITILQSNVSGLAGNQNILPRMVEVGLDSNFSRFSAIETLDWQARDRVWKELESGRYGNNPAASQDFGNAIPTTHYAMTTLARTPTGGYTLQIQIAKTADKRTAASYSETCTLAELENSVAIQRASMKLLQDMGIMLTAQAQRELSGGVAENVIRAQSRLAQGITAQRQGFEIEALSYFFQAAKFDPSLPEAANRSEILAANISSGNIGEDMRNDVQWRKDWIARLAETEQYIKNYNDNYYKYFTDYYNNFIKEYNASWDSLVRQKNAILNQRAAFINSLPAPPYTLYYTVDARPSGVIDYKTETTSFTGIKALLRSVSAEWKQSIEKAIQELNDSEREMQKAEQALQGKVAEVQWTVPAEQATIEAAMREVVRAVNDGLNATGRRNVWQLNPLNASLTKAQLNTSLLKTAKPDVPPINKSGIVPFSITVQLVNSRKKVIGTNTFRTSSTYSITNAGASVSDDERSTADFTNVNVYDITDNLTIQIASVNGTPVESASRSGDLLIQAVIAAEWDSEPWNYTIQKGQITQYTGKGGIVTIPRIIWGETVTSIKENAFANSKLTSVTIPNSVTSIGNNAFANNNLTSIIIPNSVTSIGNNAFANNNLTSIIIPNSVTSIGNNVFANNRLTSVTIPNSVTSIGNNAFGNTLTIVTIGANVTLGSSTIGSGFEELYNRKGRPAQTYMRRNSSSSTWCNNLAELDFSFDPTTGTITGYTGNTRMIIIPKTIDGIPVTTIASGVFKLSSNSDVSISIGRGVKLNNSAFTGSDFSTYYTQNGRKAGIYSYVSFSNARIKNVLAKTELGSALSLLTPDTERKWQYTPGN